ncbi:hypothetical protein BUALT_Bualt19G0092300 [Buddleja alternifolia]|uniref:F-box domain-containing protein n=1 Tax=Buddleja alternifolia TaxID=168488 RepID=A0AAV6W6D5_9LAMI|nr:hypothetical protein BUALT_Bualt19G0092300 [Buddleja alternifolia]
MVVLSLMELPLNNLVEILSRLPIKTIFICRCVCKTFRDLTSNSNPYFIALHSQNAATQHDLIIQFGYYAAYMKGQISLLDAQIDINPEKKLRVSSVFNFPYCKNNAQESHEFGLVNACNGLIYCANKSSDRYSFVCNPITREYIRVPDVDEERKLRDYICSLWLGFSPISKVYKVIGIYYTDDSVFGAHIHVVGSSTSWRDVDYAPLADLIDWHYSYAFTNGIGYWLCHYDHLLSGGGNFIVSFDFEREIFGKINAPPSFDDYSLRRRASMRIGVLGDLLCLIDNNHRRLDIWIVNECGQWIKQFSSVRAVHKPLYQKRLRPLQLLSSTGEILMVSNNRDLVCYDMKRNRSRSIKIHMRTSDNFYVVKQYFNAVNFVPSFVPLKDALMGN